MESMVVLSVFDQLTKDYIAQMKQCNEEMLKDFQSQ